MGRSILTPACVALALLGSVASAQPSGTRSSPNRASHDGVRLELASYLRSDEPRARTFSLVVQASRRASLSLPATVEVRRGSSAHSAHAVRSYSVNGSDLSGLSYRPAVDEYNQLSATLRPEIRLPRGEGFRLHVTVTINGTAVPLSTRFRTESAPSILEGL